MHTHTHRITPNNQITLLGNICEAPSKPPILELHLSESYRKENIPNGRNIFIVKPIKCSIQEVVAESIAAQNIPTVDIVRTPQHCSARFSRQQQLKSASYVKRSPSEEKAEIIMIMEQGGVENKISNSCGLTVKTSRFKRRNFCGNFLSFLHFPTYIIELPKRLGSSFSKPGTLYAFFLIVFFPNPNFINLNRDHKSISFTYERSFIEILDVNKLRLRCEKFQGEMAEITHPIFDQKIRCNFHSNISHNLQPHKSNMRKINFSWISCVLSVIFLCKHVFCPKSNIFIFCYLIRLSVAMHTPGIPYRSTNFNRSLKTCPKNEFFYN